MRPINGLRPITPPLKNDSQDAGNIIDERKVHTDTKEEEKGKGDIEESKRPGRMFAGPVPLEKPMIATVMATTPAARSGKPGPARKVLNKSFENYQSARLPAKGAHPSRSYVKRVPNSISGSATTSKPTTGSLCSQK